MGEGAMQVSERLRKAIFEWAVPIISCTAVGVGLHYQALARDQTQDRRLDALERSAEVFDRRLDFDDSGFVDPRFRAILNRHLENRTQHLLPKAESDRRWADLYARNQELKR